MRATDVITSATRNAFHPKLRTTLTVLSLFVGAFTLTLTTALGAGVLAQVGAPEALAAALAFPGWMPLTIMVAIARTAADIPYASATLVPPSNMVAALGSVGAVAAVEWRRRLPRTAIRRSPSPEPTTTAGRKRAAHARPTGWRRPTRLALIALA